MKKKKLLLHTTKWMNLRCYVEHKKPNLKDSILWSHLYEVQQQAKQMMMINSEVRLFLGLTQGTRQAHWC